MREIKFRAWQDNDGAVGSRMNYDVLKDSTLSQVESWGWKLMQFTGLKDKNGEEVFEGDILSTNMREHEVLWDEESAGWVIKDRKDGYVQKLYQGFMDAAEPRVSSNIYEGETR